MLLQDSTVIHNDCWLYNGIDEARRVQSFLDAFHRGQFTPRYFFGQVLIKPVPSVSQTLEKCSTDGRDRGNLVDTRFVVDKA